MTNEQLRAWCLARVMRGKVRFTDLWRHLYGDAPRRNHAVNTAKAARLRGQFTLMNQQLADEGYWLGSYRKQDSPHIKRAHHTEWVAHRQSAAVRVTKKRKAR